MSDLAHLAEEHVRDAFRLSDADFPAFPVDSWSDPAVPGQWIVLEDDEGRRSQVELAHRIVRGVPLHPGRLARSCAALVDAALGELRALVAGGDLVVSRPLPEPEVGGLHVAHELFRGVWWRLTVGYDPERSAPVAVLSCQLGKAPRALHEPEESVVWL